MLSPTISNRTKDKLYRFHCDPGHGWLAVKLKDLNVLGINENEISNYSYVRGQTAYLEEDCDAGIFINAFKNKFGCDPIIKETYRNNRSPIRSYQSIHARERKYVS